MKRQAHRPILITDAGPSPDSQLRRRQVRYLLMMLTRVVCLVLAVVLVTYQVPLLWLWVPICLVGMVIIPWLAVLLANDGPPRDRRPDPGTPRTTADTPAVLVEAPAPRIIDAD